jgi:hypothetical protein
MIEPEQASALVHTLKDGQVFFDVGANVGYYTILAARLIDISVDEVVRRTGIYPDVIKIDVEGAELSVSKGAQATLLKAKPKMFLSTHSDCLRDTSLEYLKECGYAYEVLSQAKNINPSEFLAAYARE